MSDLKSLNEYYSSVDKNLIENMFKNNNLRNLINLSTKSDLYIFNKKNKKWQLKSKDKLLKECNQIKKKEIKESSLMLSNLAKLANNNEYNSVYCIYNNLQTKIADIDKIVNCINHINISSESNNNFNPNIVNFDDINNKKESIINFNNTNNKKESIINFNNTNNEKESIINFNNTNNEKESIINLDINIDSKSESSSCENYIECYGNC